MREYRKKVEAKEKEEKEAMLAKQKERKDTQAPSEFVLPIRKPFERLQKPKTASCSELDSIDITDTNLNSEDSVSVDSEDEFCQQFNS